MRKSAFIDFDGILAFIEERLAAALGLYYQCVPDELARLRTEKAAQENPLYWQFVFSAQRVAKDAYIEGAREALTLLQNRGYEVMIVTSRPDTLHFPSLTWLRQNGINAPLIMKPAEARVTTPLLKALEIYALAMAGGAERVLVVDDSKPNRDEVSKYLPDCITAASLEEALTLTQEAA